MAERKDQPGDRDEQVSGGPSPDGVSEPPAGGAPEQGDPEQGDPQQDRPEESRRQAGSEQDAPEQDGPARPPLPRISAAEAAGAQPAAALPPAEGLSNAPQAGDTVPYPPAYGDASETQPLPPGPGGASAASGLQSFRPSRLPRALVVDVLTTSAIVLGASLVAGLLLAIAVAVGLGGAASSLGGVPGDVELDLPAFLGTLFLGAGFVLGGEVSASLGGSTGFMSGGGSGSLWVFPLLLTLGVLIAASWWGARTERRSPLSGPGLRAIAAGATGLLTALVLLLLAGLFSPRASEEGVGSFLVTSAGVRLVLCATVLVVAAVLLGRVTGSRALPGEGAFATGRRLFAALPRFVRETLTYAALTAAVFVPVALIAGVVLLVQQDAASAIPLLVLFLLNVAAVGVVLVQLGGVQAGATSGGYGGVSDTLTVFGANSGWLWAGFALAVLTAVLVAVFIGTRRPRRAGWDLAGAWRMPVAVLGGWILIALLLFGASVAGSGSILFFSGEMSASIAMSWWTPLVLFVWAIAVEAGAQALPLLVHRLSPSLHALLAGRAAVARWLDPAASRGAGAVGAADGSSPAGPAAEAAHPSHPGHPGVVGSPGSAPAAAADADAPPSPGPVAPMSPRTKKTLIGVGIGAGALVVAAVGAAIAVSVVNAGRGPVSVAQTYVDHIAAGRADEASALVDPDIPNAERGFLTGDVLDAATERISNVEIAEGYAEGDVRSLDVTYELDGVDRQATLQAERLPNEWGVLERWRISTPLVTTATVSHNGLGGASIGGVELPFDEDWGAAEVVLYPGVYEVVPDASEFFEADAVQLLAASGPSEGAEVVHRPTEALAAEAQRQVEAQLAGCAEQNVARPDGCPFSVYVYPGDTEVSWSVVEQPAIELAEDGASFRAEGGLAEATYVDSGFFGDDEEVTDEVDLSFNGAIEVADGEVVVTLGSSGWW